MALFTHFKKMFLSKSEVKNISNSLAGESNNLSNIDSSDEILYTPEILAQIYKNVGYDPKAVNDNSNIQSTPSPLIDSTESNISSTSSTNIAGPRGNTNINKKTDNSSDNDSTASEGGLSNYSRDIALDANATNTAKMPTTDPRKSRFAEFVPKSRWNELNGNIPDLENDNDDTNPVGNPQVLVKTRQDNGPPVFEDFENKPNNSLSLSEKIQNHRNAPSAPTVLPSMDDEKFNSSAPIPMSFEQRRQFFTDLESQRKSIIENKEKDAKSKGRGMSI
jgi:hypothetical protein